MSCEREHVVIWSGGCDSTLLLHKLAREHGTELKPVRAISIIGHNQINKPQQIMEERSRTRYLKFAKKQGYHIVAKTITVDSTDTIRQEEGLSQAILWLCTTIPYIGAKTDVHFGYIKHDDFWHYKNDFCSAFFAMMRLKVVHHPDAQIWFDLEWHTKSQVIKDLHSYNIPENCYWYCENPKKQGRSYKTCGICCCCKRHKRVLEER